MIARLSSKSRLALSTFLALFVSLTTFAETVPGRWSVSKINSWYESQPWPVGANFVPRTAINQLEMWQPETWDPRTIDQEFGWAAEIGMNTMRVFLHDILWQGDPEGMLDRMNQFLQIADSHDIKILFVFFDGVWDPHPFAGPQRQPRPHVHNSGWVQSPGRDILRDPSQHGDLKNYVQSIIRTFKDDDRIFGWDLFNEPDNPNPDAYPGLELENKTELAHQLLRKAFQWAREVNPSQPLTAGIWRDYAGYKQHSPIFEFMLENADIISFHNYANAKDVAQEVAALKADFGRPLLCTEYMARGNDSTFDPILEIFKKDKVGAYNWGLVAGKSQTNYPWETWEKDYDAEPKLWHHDIFRPDGTPYNKKEVRYIKKLTSEK